MERKNYVIYLADEGKERIVSMTKEQADTIRWFMENVLEYEDGSAVELAENYEAEEI